MLFIDYYRNLTEAVGTEGLDEYGDVKEGEGWFSVYVNPHFPDRADQLKNGRRYKAAEAFEVDTNTYASYVHWRETLAELAGWPAVPCNIFRKNGMSCALSAQQSTGGPFWELINFSDCEGTIGPQTSAKLAKDFADFQEKADQHPSKLFKEGYAEFRKAFETSADNGCVCFW